MPNGPMLIINNILDTFTETIRIRRVFIIIFIYLKSVTPKNDSQYQKTFPSFPLYFDGKHNKPHTKCLCKKIGENWIRQWHRLIISYTLSLYINIYMYTSYVYICIFNIHIYIHHMRI